MREVSQHLRVPSLVISSLSQQVHEVMGLSKGKGDCKKPTFSNDVLRLEICSPEQDHLSVIDVPGIFKSTT